MGRAGELDLFRAALEGAPWRVLFVYGPGGVGKTALLAAFAEAAETPGVAVWKVDLRGVELSPPGFVEALAGAMGGSGRHGRGGDAAVQRTAGAAGGQLRAGC